MYFSPTIGGYNLYDTWHIVPSAKPSVPPPPVKYNTVEVPGMNGEYNYSQVMGGPTLGVIEGNWEFYILYKYNPQTGGLYTSNIKSPETVYDEMLDTLHGKYLDMSLEGETKTYKGWFSISDFKHNDNYATITIEYRLDT